MEKRELRRQYQMRFKGHSTINIEEEKQLKSDQLFKPFVPKITIAKEEIKAPTPPVPVINTGQVLLTEDFMFRKTKKLKKS